jgi:chlorinating enzyme
MQPASARLSVQQERQYRDQGYYSPIRVFSDSESAEFREHFMRYLEETQDGWEALLPRERRIYFWETHLFLHWAYRMASHPNVLDAVESILGPNLLVWSSQWFPKFPAEKTYISWHQDATYWGLHPPNVTTAWIALS